MMIMVVCGRVRSGLKEFGFCPTNQRLLASRTSGIINDENGKENALFTLACQKSGIEMS
jgi:hypothetical protein